ncbi:MAG TPA: hypothetical protein VG943_05640 [Caulobacterales bacterium]|nr:hypothetical protein [Caulobacterales bacterium]
MKQRIIAGAVLLAAVGGWASAQTINHPVQAPGPNVNITRADPVQVLSQRVEQLQARVQTLENQVQTLQSENAAQGSAIVSLAGWRATATNSISDVTHAEAALEQRFATHRHTADYPGIVYETRQFVTESHVNGDEKAQGTFISHWGPPLGHVTSPPVPATP